MGFGDYARALARGWRLVFAGLLIGGAVAVGLLVTTTPLYTSDTQLFVSSPGSTDPSSAVQGSQFSQDRTASYAQLLIGRDLATAVGSDVGLPPAQVQAEISAEVIPSTVILEVTVTDPSPARALAIARAVDRHFAVLVSQLETPPGSGVSPVTVTTVAEPVLPASPSSPDRLLYVAAGLVVGLLLGGAVAVIRDRLDTRISDEERATDAAGAAVLGMLPVDPVDDGGSPLVEQSGPTVEAIRMIRSNLQFASLGARSTTLMITSAEQGEGKTTTTIRLAQAFADSGLRVLLVDGDLRRPQVVRSLGLVEGVGLTNLLTGTATLDEVSQAVASGGSFTVLGAGPTPPNPSELLASQAMGELLQDLARRFDVVLVDAAPLLAVADAAALSALVDGVLLCIRWGRTKREDVARGRRSLDRAGARTFGAILTFVPRRATGGYEYYGTADDPDIRPHGRRRLFGRGDASGRTTEPTLPNAERLRPAHPRLPRPDGEVGAGGTRNAVGTQR